MILTTEQMKQWIDATWTEAQKVAWAKENADQLVRAYENGYKAGVAAEREECAKLCEGIAEDYDGGPAGAGADNCATAIRAR